MAVSKRESRLRRLLRKLRGCLPKSHPHHKYRSSYLDLEKQPPPPLPQHTPRHALIGRRDQPLKKTKSTNSQSADRDASPKRALPSPGRLTVMAPHESPVDETIRFVNASATSLAGNRHGAYTPRYVGRMSYPIRQQTHQDQTIHRSEPTHAPSSERTYSLPEGTKTLGRLPGVLPYHESCHIQHAMNRQLPQPPVERRHDSAADLSVRPLNIRPLNIRPLHIQPLNIRPQTYHAAPADISLEESMASMNLSQGPSARATHYGIQRSSHPPTANGSRFAEALDGREHDWEKHWEKPLQHRIGDSKGIWKTASHRLLIRNKDSIQRLEADKAIRENMGKRMEMQRREETQTQMRSIQSIEEMAEDDRRAGEEWSGESFYI
jgi:hypothetical protein